MKKYFFFLIFTLFFAQMAPANALASNVVINEIQCEGTDWIEVYNPTSNSIDISGWILSDRKLIKTKHQFIFAAGTSLKSRSFLRIVQGTTADTLDFGISCTTPEKIRLGYAANGVYTTVDEVSTPKMISGANWGRATDGATNFGYVIPTPAAANKTALPVLRTKSRVVVTKNVQTLITLRATNSPVFSLIKKIPGVSLNAKGTLTVKVRKTVSVQVRISNKYGSVAKVLVLVTK